jgi:hypothetical protein
MEGLEFWKPARLQSAPSRDGEHACRQCGGELIAAAIFCHVCGTERHSVFEESSWWRSFAGIRNALGQTTASFAAFVFGVAFMVAALLTGLVFVATTAIDWQAVQLWRIEWLLAAIACFVAGNLLRKARN